PARGQLGGVFRPCSPSEARGPALQESGLDFDVGPATLLPPAALQEILPTTRELEEQVRAEGGGPWPFPVGVVAGDNPKHPDKGLLLQVLQVVPLEAGPPAKEGYLALHHFQIAQEQGLHRGPGVVPPGPADQRLNLPFIEIRHVDPSESSW